MATTEDSSTSSAPTSNSLGLDFDQLKISELEPKGGEVVETPVEDKVPSTAEAVQQREKKKPYVNPERVKTGGPQRDKLTDEALTERMARIREQNEKIKQRRLDVQADEDAFRKTQEAERAKLAQNRKVQENVNRAREQNAQRKMDKIQSREWDSGKPASDLKTPPIDGQSNPTSTPNEKYQTPPNTGRTRGGHRGGPHRGRGGGGSVVPRPVASQTVPPRAPSSVPQDVLLVPASSNPGDVEIADKPT